VAEPGADAGYGAGSVTTPRVRARVVVVLAAVILGLGLVTSSAATLGGLVVAPLGGARADVGGATTVTLDWNVGVPAASFGRLQNVRVSSADEFGPDARIEVTARGAGGTCGGAAAVGESGAVVVDFPGCTLALVDLAGVTAVAVSRGEAVVLEGDLGGVRGTVSAFRGEVVQPAAASADFALVERDGFRYLATVSVDVPAARPEEVDGARLLLSLEGAGGAVAVARVGDDGVAVVPGGAGSRVTVDLARVLTELPRAAGVAGFAILVLRPQLLIAAGGGGYAVTTAGSTVDVTDPTPTPTPDPGPDASGLVPVATSAGHVVRQRSLSWSDDGYCFAFVVVGDEPEKQRWTATFDTRLPPMRGMDPTAIQVWNGETIAFDADSGLWTIGGTGPNRNIKDGETSAEVGYCVAVPSAPTATATP